MNGTSQIFGALAGLFNLIILLLPQNQPHNKIDDLQTDEEVRSFVMQTFPDYGDFTLWSTETLLINADCKSIFEKADLKNWQKIDLNNDGQLDLMLIADHDGSYEQIVVSADENNYNLKIIPSDLYNCRFAKVIKFQNENLLLMIKSIDNVLNEGAITIKTNPQNDTLIFKSDDIIEYNPLNNSKSNITSVEFKTTGCYGVCPVYSLKIDQNRNGVFEGIRHTDKVGKFTKKIGRVQVDDIFDLLNYINPKTLQDSYKVNHTDDDTMITTINFKDGSSKTITDNGLSGTFGLVSLYRKVNKIALETNWK